MPISDTLKQFGGEGTPFDKISQGGHSFGHGHGHGNHGSRAVSPVKGSHSAAPSPLRTARSASVDLTNPAVM